eukprot:Plantae.Rhodophyta-Purpureofilum_apyrenoidigerum.ctg1063.p1 GENE.Plantae.Rhodophyta-Purpureofilum_apyrenoidigerum.ctg1063~~Plantae.Rhodophyta-Purpureofilum_apyrenoidigerum.ctg1063.p1  ORF type:complete len:323 (-),score=76.71 Plantae.Rhodophyta-Purpureofilum_apyrenoidigerum.ctg1063:23-991(-)
MEELESCVESLKKLQDQRTVEALTDKLGLLEKVHDAIRKLKVDAYVRRSYATESREDALRDAEMADKLQPNNNRVLLAKSVALSNLGKTDEATIAVKQAADAGKRAARSAAKQPGIQQNNGTNVDSDLVQEPLTRSSELEPKPEPESSFSKADTDSKPRYEWSQDEKKIMLIIFASDIDEKLSEIEVETKELSITLCRKNHPDFFLCLPLPHEVDDKNVKKSFSSSSMTLVLLKLKVFSAWRLPQDEDMGRRRDWSKFVAPAKVVADSGGDPLNQLFNKIYGDADDDTRRAMNKSFVESGGKVLSTDWAEVKKDKVVYKGSE